MLYYFIVKKNKASETVQKIKFLETCQSYKCVNGLVYLPVENVQYILLQLKDQNSQVAYNTIYRFFNRLVIRHGQGTLTVAEARALIANSRKIKDSVVLEPGVSIKIPWGSKQKRAIVKSIQGNFVYTSIEEGIYPLVIKVELGKIREINNIVEVDGLKNQNKN